MTTTVRLTNDIKDRIIHRAMVSAFDEALKDIRKKLGVLAVKAYRAGYATAAQEKLARQSPEEWLSLTNNIKLAFYRPTDAQGVHGNHLCNEENIQVDKPLVFRGNDTLGYIQVRDAALYEAYQELVAKRKQVKDATEKLRSNIKQLVYSAGTIKKLIELWPEVTPFIPSEAYALKPQLPATLASDINSTLREAGVKVGGSNPVSKQSGGLVLVAA
jgi:uncharacterized protein YhaN